jgi:iron complex transport system substrate-binding protein
MADSGKLLDDITGEIVDAAYRLHTDIGPGLSESIHEVILARELERRPARRTAGIRLI